MTRRPLDFDIARADHERMRTFLGFLAIATLTGCSAAGGSVFTTTGTSSGSGVAGGGGAGTGTGSTGSHGMGGFDFGDGGLSGSGGGVGGAAVTLVYGQTATTLYKLDPTNNQITVVGDFQGCNGDVIDIALDKDSNMYGTTFGGVYKIDRATAVCTQLPMGAGSYPNSLSFVPVGTVDPNVEALVGYDMDNNYIRIDTTTGAITPIGQLSQNYASSGDIVSVINPNPQPGQPSAYAYLTVTGESPTGPCADCIVQVDPKTGTVIKNIGHLGFGAVFGLAFWGGSCYGFSANGNVFQIDLTNASTTPINAPPGIVWYGAASSTSAPLKPPT